MVGVSVPHYAFLVYDYGKDKYERPSSKGVWAYKPDKCVDSKFDLFLYATFKAEKEWSFNGSFSIGGQCGVDVGCVNLGINISSIDWVGIDWVGVKERLTPIIVKKIMQDDQEACRWDCLLWLDKLTKVEIVLMRLQREPMYRV